MLTKFPEILDMCFKINMFQ